MTVLSQELVRLLEYQQRYDRLRDEALKNGGRDFADLAYANSYDGPTEETIAALRKALEAPGALALQYTPYGGGTVARRLVAESLRASHAEAFQYRDVILTPGAMAALNLAFRSVREQPGDEVLVIAPCWLDYPAYLENLGLSARLVPVDDKTLRLDIDRIRQTLSPRTKAVIFSQPANPSGLLYSPEEFQELANVLTDSESQPLLISDECHRDLVFAPNEFVSPVAFYDKTCVVFSFGKGLHLQGQRAGYLAVSPRHPQRAQYAKLVETLTRVMGFCTPTALMQLALGDLLRVRVPTEVVARRRALAVEELSQAGYDLVPSQATFFLYPKAPGGDGTAFAEQLARKGVSILPAAVFHHEGHFRISLTTSDKMLETGLAVLADVLSSERREPS